MNREEFILLPLSRKVELLWDHAEVISQRAYYECNITLFLLNNFYVEVFFHREKNEIIGVELQDSPQILYCYINDVDLGELTKLLQ